MAELRIGTEHEVGDVQNLALLMVDPRGHGLNPHDHWQKTAYSLLVGCILHLCYKSRYDGSPANLAALGQMLSYPKRPINDLWAEMLSFPHIHGANHPVVGASARDMLDRPPNEAGSVLSTTKSYLDLLRDPTIAKNTSRSDFRIQATTALKSGVRENGFRSGNLTQMGNCLAERCLLNIFLIYLA